MVNVGTAGQRVVPPAGFEPALPPPEGGALSPELRGPCEDNPSARPGTALHAGPGLACRRVEPSGATPGSWCCVSAGAPTPAADGVATPAGTRRPDAGVAAARRRRSP